jgi:glutamine cyclotransferase
MSGEPDWLALDGRGVWVQQDSGGIVVVDPATLESRQVVDVGDTELCGGMGAAFRSVWTCARGDVLRINPDSGRIIARLKIHKQAAQGHLLGGFDRLWVLTGDGSHLAAVDPATNQVASDFELPARCTEVTLAADAVWLACPVDDKVLEVDPTSGEVLLDADVADAVVVAVDGDEVWVGTATDTVRLDPDSGEVLAELGVPAAPEGDVELSPDSIWVRNGDDFLVRFDRRTGQAVEQITASVTSGGDMMLVGDQVWVSANDDKSLFQLYPDG